MSKYVIGYKHDILAGKYRQRVIDCQWYRDVVIKHYGVCTEAVHRLAAGFSLLRKMQLLRGVQAVFSFLCVLFFLVFSMQSTAGGAVENVWFAFVFPRLLWGVLSRCLAGFPAPGSAVLHCCKSKLNMKMSCCISWWAFLS